MATITGLTAARMLAIEAASVVDGDIVGDDLILQKYDGSTINAGNVRGPQGDAGPAGSDLVAISSTAIMETGVLNQIKAGRNLTASDFTDMNLAAPAGLWPLSGTPDTSGNGRNLTNKGSVPFTAKGIMGGTNAAARFAANVAQVLYRDDTGASDPFRIRTGTIGAWIRTAVRGTTQAIMGKYGTAGTQAYWLQITSGNVIEFTISQDGSATAVQCLGLNPVTDDKWHFVVGVCDGQFSRLYLDGFMEASMPTSGFIFNGSAVLNIGGLQGNAGSNCINPFGGVIDEAFITPEILSEDQIRNLYAVKISHALGAVPKRVSLNVRRRKKGAALVTGDFSSTPLRLYNFSAGALTDAGSNGAPLTANGSPVSVVGVDGSAGNGYNLVGASNQYLSATDTGLPSGTNTRSYGLWFQFYGLLANSGIIGYGGATATNVWTPSGSIVARSGGTDTPDNPFVGDGQWHFLVMVEENAPVDGLKRKMYIDGAMVSASTALASLVLGGANQFRIGFWTDSTQTKFHGKVDSAFVTNYAMQPEEIQALYLKGAQALGVSPKNAGDHVELMTSTNLYCIFDSLEGQHQIDLAVA